MYLFEIAKDNDTLREAYIATNRVSRAYLQRKYMISFATADDLAKEMEKYLTTKNESSCKKTSLTST